MSTATFNVWRGDKEGGDFQTYEVELEHGRGHGGEVELKPGDSALQSKTLPIDTLFHKIVMVRDKLRVLEQKINAHGGLSDGEKVDLQQYITRCYGSLTSFNVLFDDKADHFRSKERSPVLALRDARLGGRRGVEAAHALVPSGAGDGSERLDVAGDAARPGAA